MGPAFATPPAELERLAGYSRDIGRSRAEARRLLREAGVPEGFAFTFKNRDIPNPYDVLGVWLVDQWRHPDRWVRVPRGSHRGLERIGAGRKRAYRLRVWGEMKKSGKTFLAAVLLIWWAFTHANTEIIVAANDFEQVQSRVFQTAVVLIQHNPALVTLVKVQVGKLLFFNGPLVTAIAADYKGAAGSRHSLYIIDEPWGIMEERAVRLVEELTPPPTEPGAWGLLVTTAGWTGESTLLEQIYQRGRAGTRLDDELECYAADELFMFWSHTPWRPWQTGQYYGEQQRHLRPTTFARLRRNEWVTAESIFITPDLWDRNVDRDARPLASCDGGRTPAAHLGGGGRGPEARLQRRRRGDADGRGRGATGPPLALEALGLCALEP